MTALIISFLKQFHAFLFFFSTLGGLALNWEYMMKAHSLKKKGHLHPFGDWSFYVSEFKQFVRDTLLGKIYVGGVTLLLLLSVVLHAAKVETLALGF